MALRDPKQPPTKRGKHAAYSLEEKDWLLDHAGKNPRVSANQLGKALAAHANARLQEPEQENADAQRALEPFQYFANTQYTILKHGYLEGVMERRQGQEQLETCIQEIAIDLAVIQSPCI
jgi:hypothetical protein